MEQLSPIVAYRQSSKQSNKSLIVNFIQFNCEFA
jgi:hypothetical protein